MEEITIKFNAEIDEFTEKVTRLRDLLTEVRGLAAGLGIRFQEVAVEEIQNLPNPRIQECKFSNRALNQIAGHTPIPYNEIRLKDVANVSKSEMRGWGNMGKVTICEIESILATYGYKMKS